MSLLLQALANIGQGAAESAMIHHNKKLAKKSRRSRKKGGCKPCEAAAYVYGNKAWANQVTGRRGG